MQDKQAQTPSWKTQGNGLRLLDSLKGMHPTVKLIAREIILHLNAESGHRVAWPTHTAIAKNLNIGESTVRKHMNQVLKLGLFKKVKKDNIQDAKLYLQSKGANPKFNRCQHYVPNIYERINHRGWEGLRGFPLKLKQEMVEISHATPKRMKSKPKPITEHVAQSTNKIDEMEKQLELMRKTNESLQSQIAVFNTREAELTRREAGLAAQEQPVKPSPITTRVKETAESHAPNPAQEPIMSGLPNNLKPSISIDSALADIRQAHQIEKPKEPVAKTAETVAEKPIRPRTSKAITPSSIADFISASSSHVRATKRSELFDRNSYFSHGEPDESDKPDLSITRKFVAYSR